METARFRPSWLEGKMAKPNPYIVRRCDNFYRFWSDVTGPAPMANTKAAFDQLTDGGRHSVSPDDFEYFDIFAAPPPPGWDKGGAPLIRRLRRTDAALLDEHFLALDREDRRLRFFCETGDKQIRAYVRNINWDQSIILGAIQDDRLIGVSEAHLDRAFAPNHAEIAITVSRPLRGRGLGSFLVDQTIVHVSAHGVLRTSLYFLGANRPIQSIVLSLGGALDMSANETDGPVGEIPPRPYIPLAAAA
jgi:GNAT superfamily N-acetyltransferase